MGTTFKSSSCAHCSNCDDLLKEIEKRLNSTAAGGGKGIVTRRTDQIFGCITPQITVSTHPSCANFNQGTTTWDGHNEAIGNAFPRLDKLMNDFDDNDCGDELTDPDSKKVIETARALRALGREGVKIQPGDYKGPQGLPVIQTPSSEFRFPRVPAFTASPRSLLRGRRSPLGGGGGGLFQLVEIFPVL